MKHQTSSHLFSDAKQYIPGGVNSPVRAFKSVGGTPIFMKEAKGAYLTDVDGNEYIDYINSWGPMILGHAHPLVVKGVKEQLNKGFSYGTPTELETEVARLITSNVPYIDKVRMVNSGTEACMSAVRLARGYTGRNKIIKFEGCYHGHADAFLIKAGSGALTLGHPNSPGVTAAAAKDTLIAHYNDIDSVEKLFLANEENIACVIVEPVAGNMGCVPPKDDFLQKLRDLCTTHNTLLIFDEVMTGFRLSIGGAQELFNIQADIVCYGKVIGGGMPVGAFGATNKIMERLSPQGPIYQAGTLSGNPIAMRAGYETLLFLKENINIYDKIEQTTLRLKQEIQSIFNTKSIKHTINSTGSMMSIFFGTESVSNFTTAVNADHKQFNDFFHHCLQQGIYLPPSGYETWFICNAINNQEIEKTLDVITKF